MSQQSTPPAGDKLLYTAEVHTVGGREHGTARSADGQLEVRLVPPGTGRPGTNPEQLFAAGWSACFEGAIALVARKRRIKVEPAIDAEVDLLLGPGGYFIRARLNVSLPGLDRETGLALLEEADHTCPYSKAVRGNIDAAITLV